MVFGKLEELQKI